ncbi:hypothetical protein, partial [Candidatus Liberibacter sp.]|uniref:hypothetical protein n=1 Tax=Candidatus Liberibacter sp. TaxID=34022 RepID=UPI0015F41B90
NHTALEDIRRYFKNRQVQDSDKYGPISLIFVKEKEEYAIEMELPTQYPISPEIAFDLQHITGVIDVLQKMRDE